MILTYNLKELKKIIYQNLKEQFGMFVQIKEFYLNENSELKVSVDFVDSDEVIFKKPENNLHINIPLEVSKYKYSKNYSKEQEYLFLILKKLTENYDGKNTEEILKLYEECPDLVKTILKDNYKFQEFLKINQIEINEKT